MCLFQVVIRECVSLVHLSEYIFPAARNCIVAAEPGPDRDVLEHRVLATETLWENVKDKADDRQHCIETVFPSAEVYDDAYRVLNQWVKEIEYKVVNMRPVNCEEKPINAQIQFVKVKIWVMPNNNDIYFLFIINKKHLSNTFTSSKIMYSTRKEENHIIMRKALVALESNTPDELNSHVIHARMGFESGA